MKWKSAVCFYLFFPVMTTRAQWSVGFQTGPSRSTVRTSSSVLNDQAVRSAAGWYYGVPVTYALTGRLQICSGFSFLDKGYRLERTGAFSGIYQQFEQHYLQLPLMVGLHTNGPRLRAAINIGVYSGYWLSGNIKANVPDIFSLTNAGTTGESFGLTSERVPYAFNSLRDQRFEWGLAASGDIEFRMGQKSSAVIDLGYDEGLSDTQKRYMLAQTSRMNRSTVFSAGYRYHF